MTAASLDALPSVTVVSLTIVTRAAPYRAMARAGCAIGSRPALRHPAQHASASTVGLLACGSPPVTAFPGCPSGRVARARRLQLRGQLRPWNFRSAPHSLFALA